MEAQLRELLDFLHDRNPNVRQIALSNLLGHTDTRSQYRNIFLPGGATNVESPVIRDLKLLCRDQLAIAHDAFVALVNLSDSPTLATSLSEESFLAFLSSYIITADSKLADLAAMLLSNITKNQGAAARLLRLKVQIYDQPKIYAPQSRAATSPPPLIVPSVDPTVLDVLPLLLDAFVDGARVKSKSQDAVGPERALHFLSSVFANISVLPDGRNFLVTPLKRTATSNFEYPVTQLIAFTEHEDIIRRGGVVTVLKNCAFNVQAHKALLSPSDELLAVPPPSTAAPGIDVLQYILLPLAGPEELDLEEQESLPLALQFLPASKQRETDDALRLLHVETLTLFCTTRWGRDFLRTHGVYEIIRVCHETETDDKVSDCIERLVNLLKRDEGDAADEITVERGHEPDDDDNTIQEF